MRLLLCRPMVCDLREPEYDAATCVHARELRARGFTIPAEIPDVAWIPRDSIKFEVFNHTTPADVAKGLMKGGMRYRFTEPFRWVAVDFAITPEGTGA